MSVKQLGATPLSTNKGKMLLRDLWQRLLSHRARASVCLPQFRDGGFLLGATSACCVLVWHTDLIVIDCLIKANCVELHSNPRREEGIFS